MTLDHGQTLWDGNLGSLYKGTIVKYSYCWGVGYEGIGVLRGKDGWEYWIKTLIGDNHFNTKNFVITTDVKLFPVTEEEFSQLNYGDKL